MVLSSILYLGTALYGHCALSTYFSILRWTFEAHIQSTVSNGDLNIHTEGFVWIRFNSPDPHTWGSKLRTLFLCASRLRGKSIVTYYLSPLLAPLSYTELAEPPVAQWLECPLLEEYMPTPQCSMANMSLALTSDPTEWIQSTIDMAQLEFPKAFQAPLVLFLCHG